MEPHTTFSTTPAAPHAYSVPFKNSEGFGRRGVRVGVVHCPSGKQGLGATQTLFLGVCCSVLRAVPVVGSDRRRRGLRGQQC